MTAATTTAVPRLKERYREQIASALREEFGYGNPMQVPRLVKIVVNMGVGEAARDAKLMEIGENVYKTGGSSGIACITCHMDKGQGVPPAFPPLAGSKDIMGDCKQHAGYVVKGLTGEITVAGTKYNGVMPAQPNLSDLEIAAVITFERNSFGNDDGICMPADVAAVR